jgi:hypothetical protein
MLALAHRAGGRNKNIRKNCSFTYFFQNQGWRDSPIVSTSFSLTSIYKHHLTFLVICEQHEIDNYVYLPAFY